MRGSQLAERLARDGRRQHRSRRLRRGRIVCRLGVLGALASLYAAGAASASPGSSPLGEWRAGASSAAPGHPAQAALPANDAAHARTSRSWRATGAAPQWLVVDLGQPTRLHGVTQRFPEVAPWRFVVQGSDSGATAQGDEWMTLVSHDGRDVASTFSDSLSGSYRYVRLVVLSGGIPASLRFDIRGDSLPVPPAPPLATSLSSPLGPIAPGPVVVMQSCELWSSAWMWRSVLQRQPANRPLLGVYDDAYAEVADRHIAMALAAGVSAFQACWFREKGNAGQPVMTEYEGFVSALAGQARLRGRIRWSLFWDNTNPAADGVSGLDDLLTNVAPFWIDHYLTRPNYLRIDGKPLLVISGAQRLSTQLGGEQQARRALAGFRSQAREAGLPGLLILTCNVGDPHASNQLAKTIGFDGVMSYATPIFTGLLHSLTPSDADVMQAERDSWTGWFSASAIPPILTVSVGFDMRTWSASPEHYRLSPNHFGLLLQDALARSRALPVAALGHRLLYLDNWNEFGEGHFIEPTVGDQGATLRAVASVLRPGSGHAGDSAGLLPGTMPGFVVP